jgi:hypothetical protein
MADRELPNTREWTREDQRGSRIVPERPATREGLNSGTKVDAVPQRHLMPGNDQ